MTDNEIFENEIKCIKRRASGQCNGGTDCCSCDLLMNDAEIISAYERAMQSNETIDRQQAEIERLQGKVEELSEVLSDTIKIRYKEAKTEAVKEFAERLCDDRLSNDPVVIAVKTELKEMVGEGG